jgi:NAD(P)-dependent dehydrogenase (short-subunit alcohol dehydrogenase family)
LTLRRLTVAVWLVTGAARRFGAEIVRQVIGRGGLVAAAARDPDQVRTAFPDAGDALLPTGLDVTDEDQARAAVHRAVERFGRIDVVVNNAALALVGAVEEASAAEVRACFDTNVFGLLNVARAVLPVLRRQRSGRMINISSVGGFTASSAWGVYSATKFAVEGLSEAMRAELAPLGIAVTAVEPGFFRPDPADPSNPQASRSIADYTQTAREAWAAFEHAPTVDPVKAAAAIIDMAEIPDPPARLPLGSDCVARVEAKLALVSQELTTWRYVSLTADYDRG